MKQETAICFCATVVGLLTSIFTFNFLVERNVLPSKAHVLHDQPIVASASTAATVVSTLGPSRLERVVSESLTGTTGKYSIAIKHLRTGESYSLNENVSYEAASLYKLWVMATTYDQIEGGKLKKDTVMNEEIPILNERFNLASESAEKTEGSVSLSVGSALSQMITISHNYAALLLSSKVGLGKVKTYLKEHALSESSIGQPPRTTASDTLTFFEKLYRGELASAEYSEKMLDLLKKQKLNKKLPKYLPFDTVIAHKTGELGSLSHDAGIVYTEKGDYIIVILSQSNNRSGADERLANISKAVYGYFVKR